VLGNRLFTGLRTEVPSHSFTLVKDQRTLQGFILSYRHCFRLQAKLTDGLKIATNISALGNKFL
jgi:hypothetical protein